MDNVKVKKLLGRYQEYLIVDKGLSRRTAEGYSRSLSIALRRMRKYCPQYQEIKDHILWMHNKNYSYSHMGSRCPVNDWLQVVRAPVAKREAFLRLTFQAGECAQVDWGEFGDVFGDGIKIHAFIMVLAHSRMLYVEFTRSERFEDFVRAHESAFRFFGGAPRECWYDNLATAMTERLGKLVRFNSRF